MRNGGYVALLMALMLTGCDSSGSATPTNLSGTTATENGGLAETFAETHNYQDRDGHTYLYVTAVSEEEQKRGVAIGSVQMFRYVGSQAGKILVAQVDEGGNPTARFECASPCKIIKMTAGLGVSRFPYDPGSIIGAVFEDAIGGRLEAETSAVQKPEADTGAVHDGPKNALGPIPAAFVGEWTEDIADCGSALDGSRLRVEPGTVAFYESTGRVQRVDTRDPRSITVYGSFAGEGETWQKTLQMKLSQSGDDLTIDDTTRHRCAS